MAVSLLERGESSSETTFDFTTIDVPGASTTGALDINNEGVIVGRYASAGRTHGFVRSTAGELTTIDFPGAGFTVAGALNNRGDIVGWYTLPAAPVVRHGFLLRDGEFTTFDPPGSIFTNVLGINDHGEIVGRFCTLAICLPFPGNGEWHGFLLREGEFTTIDFPGSHETNVFKINDRGQIAGGYGTPDGNELPFVLSRKGKFTSIALPGARQISQDNGGLNGRGDIVGIYCDGAPPCFFGPTRTHGYVLSANDFATIDVPGALATTAVGINTRGEIVGSSFDASGSGHGYLLRWGHLGVIAARRDANDDAEDSPRAGTFHAQKNCAQYSGLAGGFCTLTVSTLKQIPVGTKVVYASAATATALSSDLMLVPPPGNSVAFGHVELNRVTRTGTLTFSGGTGKFQHFSANVTISFLYPQNWAWDATYSFGNEGEED